MKSLKKRATSPHTNYRAPEFSLLLIFLVVLAFIFTLSFFPGLRLWGLNCWAYLSTSTRIVFLAIAACLAWTSFRKLKSEHDLQKDISSTVGVEATASLFLILVVLMLLIRAKVHFLGDGNQLLSHLAGDRQIFQWHNIGGQVFPYLISRALGGPSDRVALLSYQIISFLAGLCWMAAAIWVAYRTGKSNTIRVLLLTALMSGGYMLLFLGYLETYPLFVASVLCFLGVGIAVLNRRLPKWLLLVMLTVSIFLHIFGVALVPATLYLLFRDTWGGRRMGSLGTSRKIALAVGLVVLGIALVEALRTNSFFVRFAFLPLRADVVTPDGYTLFSVDHILDFANLLILLFPSLPILIWVLFKTEVNLRGKPVFTFLGVTSLSSIILIFVVNPKLGMPRDWDLLSFAVVPAMLLIYQAVLEAKSRLTIQAMVLAILANLAVLVPRVAVLGNTEKSINQFKDYATLDVAKNRAAYHVLLNYYAARKDTANLNRENRTFELLYPEGKLLDSGRVCLDRGEYKSALTYYERVRQGNPVSANGWNNIGAAYLQLRNYDSALFAFRVADGLNPFNAFTNLNIAITYLNLADTTKVLLYAHRAKEISPEWSDPLKMLTLVYGSLHDAGQYQTYLSELVKGAHATSETFMELAEQFASGGDVDLAKQVLQLAIDKGANSSRVSALVDRYPKLRHE